MYYGLLILNGYATEEHINASTKAELIEAIKNSISRCTQFGNLKKEDLIDVAIVANKEAFDSKNKEEAKVEDERQELLNKELNDGGIQNAIWALMKGIKKERNQRQEVLQRRLERIKEAGAEGLYDTLSWSLVDVVFLAGPMFKRLNLLHGFLIKRIEDQDITTSQIIEWLTQEMDQGLQDCLESDGYRHNSTSMIQNERNIVEHRATQRFTKYLKDLIKYFKKDLENATELSCHVRVG